MISFRLAGRLGGQRSECLHVVKTFNIFLKCSKYDVKLCMMVALVELCPIMPLSVTLIVFQGHSSVNQFQLRILCSHLAELKLCAIFDYVKKIMHIPLFFIFVHAEVT